MDNIIQIERLRYMKICGERTLFHDLINNCPGKSENMKPQGSLCVLLFFSPTIIFESSCSKISQNSIGNTRGGFLIKLQGGDLYIYRN